MNPVKVIMNMMLADPRIKTNELAKDAIKMMEDNNVNGLKEMAENMCKERNIKPDDVKNEILKRFGY